jgi:hypothetical protein
LFRQSAYFERRRPGYGSLFIAEIEMAVALASHQPLLGAAEVLGCRSWRVNRFPFRVVYQVQPDRVWIVALRNLSRRRDYWKRRIE